MPQPKTIEELLWEAGYDYRSSMVQPYKRQIFRREDGKVIGDFDAHEAVEWLQERKRRLLGRPGCTTCKLSQ